MLKKPLESSIKLFFILFLFSCNTDKKENTYLQDGNWRFVLDLGENNLPFNVLVKAEKKAYSFTIINGKESIEVKNIIPYKDSISFEMPVFESSFFLKLINDSLMHGVWANYYKGDDYKIPVIAEKKDFRFSGKKEGVKKLKSKYEVSFSANTKEESKAIGIFEQKGKIVTASFATETGDYRHLEGEVAGDSLFLSTFDGSHAFLFKAAIKKDSLSGVFWSGTHFKENWLATKNDTFSLRNPDSLTFINETDKEISFELINQDKEAVSFPSSSFDEKVVIIQIMGSWCPNCLDETNYYTSLYDKFYKRGLEIIPIAFERTKSKEKALININKLKEKSNAPYNFLLGGSTREEKAIDLFPMLNHIMSYPTSIYIDKKGNVRKIHTGFYGPGTGDYYVKYTEETEVFVKRLLEE